MTGRRSTAGACVFLTTLLTAPVSAGGPLPYALHEIDTFGVGGGQASAVAVAPPFLVVGAPEARVEQNGSEWERAGIVTIARWHAGEADWQTLHRVDLGELGQTAQDGTRFGAAVAISEQRVLIGCPGCPPGQPVAWLLELIDEGDAYIAHPLDPQPRLPDVHDPEGGLASAVALSREVIAIGSPRALRSGTEVGEVLLGRHEEGVVVWEHGFQGWPLSRFGHSLATTAVQHQVNPGLFTHFLAVGAPDYRGDDGKGEAVGWAGVYTRAGDGQWQSSPGGAVERGAPVLEPGDRYGSSVAIHRFGSNDARGYLAVGAPGRVRNGQATGSVLVFFYFGLTGLYLFNDELFSDTPGEGDAFGSSVAVRGVRLLVGAPGQDVEGVGQAGAVHVFARDPGSQLVMPWESMQTLTPSLREGSRAGSAVALTDRAAVVGAPRYPTRPQAGELTTYLCDALLQDGFEEPPSGTPCSMP